MKKLLFMLLVVLVFAKTNFGGAPHRDTTDFSTESKGYIGTGQDRAGYKTDFWEYHPAAAAWIQKADFSEICRSVTTGFSIEDKGHIGTGIDGLGSNPSNFREADPCNAPR